MSKTLDEVTYCPTCNNKLKLESQTRDEGDYVYTYVCANKLCPDNDLSSIFMTDANGVLYERAPGPKLYQVNDMAKQAAQRNIENLDAFMKRGEL